MDLCADGGQLGIPPRTAPFPESWGLPTGLGNWLGWREWVGGNRDSLSLQSWPGPQPSCGGRGDARAGRYGGRPCSPSCLWADVAQRRGAGRPSSSFFPAGCPQGRFGPGCAHVCRCGQGAVCDPVTGSCSCPPGRTGVHCEHGEHPLCLPVVSHGCCGVSPRCGPMGRSRRFPGEMQVLEPGAHSASCLH